MANIFASDLHTITCVRFSIAPKKQEAMEARGGYSVLVHETNQEGAGFANEKVNTGCHYFGGTY